MEKTSGFLPRVMRWKSEGRSSHPRGSMKKMFLKFRKIYEKTPVPESLFQ